MLLYRSYSVGSDQGDGYFLCDPQLPHNAVVTKVSFTLEDSDPVSDVRYCALYRNSLNPATATLQDLLAQVPATFGADMNAVRLTDTTIQFAKVDNANFAYHLQCQITHDTRWTGIYGAVVTYRITAANG